MTFHGKMVVRGIFDINEIVFLLNALGDKFS